MFSSFHFYSILFFSLQEPTPSARTPSSPPAAMRRGPSSENINKQQTSKQTNSQTDRRTDKQTNKETNTQTHNTHQQSSYTSHKHKTTKHQQINLNNLYHQTNQAIINTYRQTTTNLNNQSHQ